MVIDMFIFMLLAMRYKYVEHAEDPEEPATLSEECSGSETGNGYISKEPININPSKGSLSNGVTNEAYVHMDEK